MAEQKTPEAGGSLTIVCSDTPRNGKTILAKLAADLLRLRHGDAVTIHDTDAPHGDIIRHFPDSTRIVDLEKTPQQVALIDGILGDGGGHHVIDLAAHHFERFFAMCRDIGFGQGAQAVGLPVSVLCIIDRTPGSLAAAAQASAALPEAVFVPVRNAAIGDTLSEPGHGDIYDRLARDGERLIPALSGAALGMVEHTDFHFDRFMAGGDGQIDTTLRGELWDFLEVLYEQRAGSRSGTGEAV